MAAGDDAVRCLNGDKITTSEYAQELAINGSPPNCDPANSNGVVFTADNGSCEWTSGAATYKRQKHCKKSSADRKCHQVANTKVSAMGALKNQTAEDALDMVSDETMLEQINKAFHDVSGNDSCHNSNLISHRVILDQIYQTLSDDGGVGSCIQNALTQDTKIGKMKIKSGLNSLIKQDFEDATGSESSFDGADQFEINQMCKNALSGVLSSRKFTFLCKFLVENFEGTKYDQLLNFGIINTRLKQGIYEHSPTLFMVDTEEIWGKLEEIGTELVSLARSLSDVTKTSCYEHVGISSQSSGDRNFTVNGHRDAKMEQPTEDSGVRRIISTCKQCGNMADDRECLVCDSCERMRHLSCIPPPIREIPSLNWYCSNWIGNGIRPSAHDNCAVCRKLNAPENVFVKKEVAPSENPDTCCKICRLVFFTDEKLRECGHYGCNNTYHERCLGGKQLESFGPLWYCPSCLCRACLINQDDEQIILCDGCDDSYHMYCLRPKLEEVPSNKWFCLNCKSGIQAVIEAKQACEGVKEQRKRKKKDET